MWPELSTPFCSVSISIFLRSHVGMPQVTALGILLELVVSLHFYWAWHWSVLLSSLSKLNFIWNVLWALLFVLIRRYFTIDALALYLSVLPVYILMSLALVCFASASLQVSFSYGKFCSVSIQILLQYLLWWLCGLRRHHWLHAVSHHCLGSNHSLGMWESCHWLGARRWLSLGTAVFSTTSTG